jgi:hypothetical protein
MPRRNNIRHDRNHGNGNDRRALPRRRNRHRDRYRDGWNRYYRPMNLALTAIDGI